MSTMLPMTAARASGGALDRYHALRCRRRPGNAGARARDGQLRLVPDHDVGADLASEVRCHRYSALRMVHCVGPAICCVATTQRFPHAYLMNAYGLTEAAGVPVYSDPADPQEVSIVSNGRPFPGVEARVVGLGDRCRSAAGHVRRNPAARQLHISRATTAIPRRRTRAAAGRLAAHRRYRCDRCRGRVIYSGRAKDMLKIGGENVAAIEIESYPVHAPGRAGGAGDRRAGRSSARGRRRLRRAATRRHGAPADLAAFCVGRIASFKVPVTSAWSREWPMSATKIQKFKLQAGVRGRPTSSTSRR